MNYIKKKKESWYSNRWSLLKIELMLLNVVKCAFSLLKWDLFLLVSTFNGKLFDGVEDTNCWTWSLLQNCKEHFVLFYRTYNCKKRKTYECNHVFKEFGQCSINFFLSWINTSCLQSKKIGKNIYLWKFQV